MKYLALLLLLSQACTKQPLNDPDKPGLLTTTCSQCVTTLGTKQGPTIYFRYAKDTVLNIQVTAAAHLRVFNRVNVMLWDTTVANESSLTYRFKN